MHCHCQIVPKDVLLRFARDRRLSRSRRKAFAAAARFEDEWRRGRSAQTRVARAARMLLPNSGPLAGPPAITVYDCRHATTLPGVPVTPAGKSADGTVLRAFEESMAVADFYRTVFDRNSVDDAGKTLMSSVHFGIGYNNAFWNGNQMTYGDGDGQIFVDFTRSTDVIGHELTHGVTQFSAQFGYSDEAGGLNESISDVFGSMFRQWRARQTVTQADWLIGRDVMGPAASARGYTCLRDLSDPAAKHCLSPQITHFSQYRSGMDPHYSSGIANLAFQKAAMAIGGRSWDTAGMIWYAALTGFPPWPTMKMKTFANRTRTLAKKLFSDHPSVAAAVHAGWAAVGL